MALSKEQYDSIMNIYAQKRSRHRQILARRQEEIYARIPEYRDLEEKVPSVAVRALRRRLDKKNEDDNNSDSPVSAGSEKATGSAQAELQEISERKKALLLSHGYPSDYLTLGADCPFCHDTGYIGGKKCSCFRREEISLLYDQSHLKDLVKEQNFDVLREDYYQGEDLQRFRTVCALCRRFVDEFSQNYRNLYFYGTVGTGKSFLSICIAKELLDRGIPVLYFSAAALFDRLSAYSFDHHMREELRSFTSDLYNVDLLIIDDLGTELTNQFVASQLFACLNERALAHKSTIISTNLSLAEMQNRYSDRVFSRITSSYELCKLTGRDIRLLRLKRRLRR